VLAAQIQEALALAVPYISLYYPDVLQGYRPAVLRRRLVEQEIANVAVVETTWEQAEVEPHDIVIAIWSLYRQPDILAALRKLVEVTRRTLVIADGDSGLKPPHAMPHPYPRSARHNAACSAAVGTVVGQPCGFGQPAGAP